MNQKNRILASQSFEMDGTNVALTILAMLGGEYRSQDGVNVLITCPSSNANDVEIRGASAATQGDPRAPGTSIELSNHVATDSNLYANGTGPDVVIVTLYGQEPAAI